MNYRLIVLTHGKCAPLFRTLNSFVEYVTPRPADAILVYDGARESPRPTPAMEASGLPFLGHLATGGVGFCRATGRGWQEAVGAEPYPDYVFWLEHDFLFTRPVDLTQLALLLDRDPRLAQVAMMRDAVNSAERAAGGLFEARRRDYNLVTDTWRYLEHCAYFTTNPSLMTRRFMAENPWMAHVPQCEGQFGIDLVARGYHFGAWGEGEPWVTHIGERDGHGY